MALLVEALLALAVGLFATVSGLDRDRAFYPTVAVVIASYYSLFAVMGASTRAPAHARPQIFGRGVDGIRDYKLFGFES